MRIRYVVEEPSAALLEFLDSAAAEKGGLVIADGIQISVRRLPEPKGARRSKGEQRPPRYELIIMVAAQLAISTVSHEINNFLDKHDLSPHVESTSVVFKPAPAKAFAHTPATKPKPGSKTAQTAGTRKKV